MATMDLPLFPLNAVLLPTTQFPLHIFEERYRLMIRECLVTDRRFGAVLIRDGEEVGATASPYDVGTVAEITAAQPFEDGRMALIAEGRQRFRILEHLHDRPYLHGLVEWLDETVGLQENVAPLAMEIRTLARRYARVLLKLAGREEIEMALPAEPIELSYKVAELLQVKQHELQALLEMPTAEERLRRETVLLRREYAILQQMAAQPSVETHRYFHPN